LGISALIGKTPRTSKEHRKKKLLFGASSIRQLLSMIGGIRSIIILILLVLFALGN
jgi:hypothetical protein